MTPTRSPSHPTNRLQHALLLLLIAVVTFAAYSNTIVAPFVFDDIHRIVDNPQIRSLEHFFKLRMITAARPLVDFTFALNYYFHGLELWGYHLVNIFIHILNGWLVYALTLHCVSVLCFSVPPPCTPIPQHAMALTAALLFTLHPIQTQAVTYVVQRYTSLAALFYLTAVLCYVLGRRIQLRGSFSDTARRVVPLKAAACFVLVPLCGILAFLSKQHVASLPAAIILLEFILFDRSWAGWKRKLIWIVPGTLLFMIFILYNVGFFMHSTGGGLLEDVSSLMQETDDVGRATYFYTQFRVIVLYLLLLILPVFQNPDHFYPFVDSFWSGWTPLAAGALLLMAGSAVVLLKKHPLVSLGIGWFFISISVESSILPIQDAMFEHRMYLPVVGITWIAVWKMAWLSSFLKLRRVMPLLTCLIILILCVTTFQRNKIWSDHVSLWQDAVTKAPHNHRAHVNLALAFEDQQQPEKAELHYARAFQRKPDYAYAHLNYGAFLERQGRHTEALEHFRQAIAALPNFAPAYNNLGSALASRGHLEASLPYFEEAIRLDRRLIAAYENIVLTCIYLEQYDDASEWLIRLLKINPENDTAPKLLKSLNNR